MPYLIDIPKITDDRGTLNVVEKILPFDVKRIFYIYDVTGTRGGHRHKKNIMGLICINGSCRISTNNSLKGEDFILEDKNQCLILEPQDWHTMKDFTQEAILLVLASHEYDQEDYITEPYK